MDNIEIEIQVNVEDSKPLLAFLNKNGIFQSEQHQIDEYFLPPHRNFTDVRPIQEWLRIRSGDGSYFLNYKNWHFDANGRSHCCDEYETTVGDLDKVKNILSALDFKPLVIVDKVRRTWTYGDYEIAVDTLKGLGDFVEIEYKGDNQNVQPEKVTDEMVRFLKNIGCKKIRRNYVGYPFLLLFPNEVEWEEL